MRVPTNVHTLHHGESLTWTPPAGTAKYIGWLKSALMPYHSENEPAIHTAFGGAPPAWIEIGGYDISGDAAIASPHPRAGKNNFDDAASADGVTVEWSTLVALTDGVDSEVLQIISYDAYGRAIQLDMVSVPAPLATDASTIAAQERIVLQSLLLARAEAAGQGGAKKIVLGENDETEFENLAVLDRLIAEIRARISWFEQAAGGNVVPRQEHW